MLQTVEGRFKDGKVHLDETPTGMAEARVLVTFLPTPSPRPPGKCIFFGMFPGDGVTNEEDFKIAEWRAEPEIWDAK